MNTLLIVFFHIKGTVHFEFTSQSLAVNQVYYVEILKRLHEAVKKFLTQNSTTEREYPSYPHHLAPDDFWLFQKIKSALKG
jgi:hypothetical protein